MTKMAPSFRPEIRASSFFLLILLITGACASSEEANLTSDSPTDPALGVDLALGGDNFWRQAGTAAAQGDFNRALNLFDQARKFPETAKSPEFWCEFGRMVEAFIAQRVAEGETNGMLLADLHREAAGHFAKSIAQTGSEGNVRLEQARSLRLAGDFSLAWNAVDACLANIEINQDEQIEIGRVGLALTIENIQAGLSAPAAASDAAEILHRACEQGQSEAPVLLSDLYAWQGLQAEARTVLIEALSTHGGNDVWIGRLKNLTSADPKQYATDMELVRNARPGDGWVLWFTGEAWYLRQVQARNGRNFVTAYEAIDRAEECFMQAKVLREDFTTSCQDWLHLTRCARGWALWQEGRIPDASQAFLAALEMAPEKLEAEATEGTLRLGLEAVVGDAFKKRDNLRARKLLKRIVRLHQESATWWNNLALATRDIAEAGLGRGVVFGQVELNEEQTSLINEAWTAYSKAVELAPNDPNMLNDHALIAVWYLDHSLELAEQELHRAIRCGEERLLTINKDEDYETWRYTDMSIGDAWQNLAHIEIGRRLRIGEAPSYLANSVKHWPYERRAGVVTLREMLKELQNKSSTESPQQ